jgi:hypothetical protein
LLTYRQLSRRVKVSISKLKILCIGILALLLFAPAAGAIYIPGQTIPDDGMYHIMAADDGAASSGVAPSSMDISGNFAAMPVLGSGASGTPQTLPLIGKADMTIPVSSQVFPDSDPSMRDAKNGISPGS